MAKDSDVRKGQEVQKAAPSNLMPFEEMESALENFFPRGWSRPGGSQWPALRELSRALESRFPHIDVIDRDDEILVKAEVPGVDKKDLDVSVTDDAVTIRGSTRHEEEEQKENYYRREISHGTFARTIALPAAVDSGKAKAKFKDGILELVMPKTETRKRRSIDIE